MTTTQVSQLMLAPEAQDLLFRDARTASTFTDEPVSDAQLRAIYDLLKWGPTSANTQPLRVLALRSYESKARLLPLMAEGNRAKTESAPMTLLLASDRQFDEHMPRLLPVKPEMREMFADPDVRSESADYNSILQAGYAIVAIRAAGLAAGPMLGYDAAAIDAEFFPDGRHHVVLAVNVGRAGAGAWFDRLPRMEFDEVVSVL
jgi:nitroreductase